MMGLVTLLCDRPGGQVPLLLHICIPHSQCAFAKNLASCSPGIEAASLDIEKAYQNSPICPEHKKYLCIHWKEAIYVQHITIEGLSTTRGIQGCVADATIALLKYSAVKPTIKRVDDFRFFQTPTPLVLPTQKPIFPYDLSTIFNITEPLGIPWHPVSKKGHNFQSSFTYVGFCWDIPSRTVSLSSEKCLQLLSKVSNLLITPPPPLCVTKKTIASINSSLQNITIVYLKGQSHLAPLSSFYPSFQMITCFTIFQDLVSTYFLGGQ